MQYVWSPDSKSVMHYGYPGTQYAGQFALFLGDRSVAHGTTPRIELPTFTPDAKHLFWIAIAPNNQDMQVFLDGNVVFEARGISSFLEEEFDWRLEALGVPMSKG